MGMSTTIFTDNYYELFGVSKNAQQLEIKKAYARLIRQYTNETHPNEFMHITKAYRTLSNQASRADYDNHFFTRQTNDQQAHRHSTNRQQEHVHTRNTNRQEHVNTRQQQQHRRTNEPHPSWRDNNRSHTQQNTYHTTNVTYVNHKPYSILNTIIVAVILSFLFTPVTGIIVGLIMHIFKIRIARILGCFVTIIVALLVLGFVFRFIF